MEAALAQAQQMAQARADGKRPGQLPSSNDPLNPSGAGNVLGQPQAGAAEEPAFDLSQLPDLKSMDLDDWAKLPPKVAEELLESQREGLSPEFRRQIHHYFRIIAERSRNNKAAPPPPEK